MDNERRVWAQQARLFPLRAYCRRGIQGSRNMFDTFDHSAHTDPNSAASRNHKQEKE